MKFLFTFILLPTILLSSSFDRALNSFENKNYTLAYEKFYLLHTKDKEDIDITIYLAKSLYYLGEYEDAIKKLYPIYINNLVHNDEVLLYLAKSYFNEKKYIESEKIFSKIKDKKYIDEISKYKKRITKITNRHDFLLYASLGFTYDDNIKNNTYISDIDYGTIKLKNNTNKLHDVFVDKFVYLKHDYKIPDFYNAIWNDNVFIYDRRGIKYSNEDLFLASLKSGPVFRKNGFTIKSQILFSDIYYESEHYMFDYGISLEVDKKINDFLEFKSQMSYRNKNYIQNVNKTKDANFYLVGLGLNHYIGKNDMVRYKLLYADTIKKSGSRVDISKEEYFLDVKYSKIFFSDYSVNTSFQYKDISYKDSDPVLGNRDDTRTTYAIDMSTDVYNFFNVLLKYSHVKNKSNISSYSYKKNTLSLMLSKSF